MPQLTARLRTPWAASAALWGEPLTTPWGLASALWSTGGAYTPPAPPAGGTPVAPSTGARITVPAAAVYDLVHTLQVTDLRTNSALPVTSVSIGTDRDSAFWVLRASGSLELMALLAAGEQPARVRVVIDGAQWDFLVEAVTRSRRHVATEVSVEGRSLSAAAGSPYEPERQWSLEGDTTGAQLAAAANLFTELDVLFELDDWPVPAGVFSFTGTPLGVVQRVAEAAGGMVISRRTGYGVIVRPRYAVLPNEWGTTAPDLELPLDVLDSESFRVADQPPYDGVVVSGQQQGAVGLVRLAGTSGGFQAPMVTDALLTDVIALRQRGQAVLGQGGKQQVHTLSLPVVTVAGAAVVPEPGWLVRVADAPAWVGLVTGVQVEAQLGSAVLTVTLERHTAAIEGTVTPLPPTSTPLAFSGSIPNVQVAPGAAVNVPLAGYWVNGVSPRTYSLRSGALPAWLTLNSSTGQLVGTAPGAPETSAPLAVRATDSINSTADSNEFTVGVVGSSLNYLAISSEFTGANGQTTGIVNAGQLGGAMTSLGAFLSTNVAFSAPTSLKLDGSTGVYSGNPDYFNYLFQFGGYNYGPTSDAWEFEVRLYAPSGVGSSRGAFVAWFTEGGVTPQYAGSWSVWYTVVGNQLQFSADEFGTPVQSYALNTWHKITLRRDPAKLTLLVNDVQIEEYTFGGYASWNFKELSFFMESGVGWVYVDNATVRLKALT